MRAQIWDYPAQTAESIAAEGKFHPTFEWRNRYEHRLGCDTVLTRIRLGLAFTPRKWLKVSGEMQDARAPGYGSNAPNTVRDPADLHEAYVELFPDAKKGFGMTAGRMELNYGDGRLLGVASWNNVGRTYDQARVHYRWERATIDLLFVSPVKMRPDGFNRPVLGDRMTGVWTSFPGIYKKHLLEVYLLRHDQNRPGGFTGGSQAAGTDRLGVTALGFRLKGPVWKQTTYTIEADGEEGSVGPARLWAEAFAVTLNRRTAVKTKPLDLSAEYKFASGTHNPEDPSHTGTFDQMFATNHDRFGHEDLLGWRNIHDVRGLATLQVSKSVAVNLMYNDVWLACLKDALYGSNGKAIARSPSGSAGRHAGQEADLYATYRYHHFLFGAGYGQWISGEFLKTTGMHLASAYLYFFHTYSF